MLATTSVDFFLANEVVSSAAMDVLSGRGLDPGVDLRAALHKMRASFQQAIERL